LTMMFISSNVCMASYMPGHSSMASPMTNPPWLRLCVTYPPWSRSWGLLDGRKLRGSPCWSRLFFAGECWSRLGSRVGAAPTHSNVPPLGHGGRRGTWLHAHPNIVNLPHIIRSVGIFF
jgi:hypothetical protein